MEREIIEATVANLPPSQLGEIQDDHEIWEETDGGAHIKVTRHVLPISKGIEVISLSVSGQPSERTRIISEFCSIFGEPEPEARETIEDKDGFVDVVMWRVG